MPIKTSCGFKGYELLCVFLPGGLAGNRVPPRDGSCAAMSEYKGWHVFMQRLYLPFRKELWLMEALSTEDSGWVLSSAVRMQSATMIKL